MNVFSSRTVELKGKKIVEASAGTGKTYSIAVIVLRLILSGVEINKILAVTFTQAATAELKGRIMKFVRLALMHLKGIDVEDDDLCEIKEIVDAFEKKGELLKRVAKAYSSLDELSVFTIHGFCRRILSENAFETGVLFNMELSIDGDAVLTDAVQSFWRKNVPDIPADVLGRIENEKWFNIDELKRLVKERLVFKDVRYEPDIKKDCVSWKEQKGLFDQTEPDICADLMTLLDKMCAYCNKFIDEERERTGILSFDDLLILLERTLDDKARKKLLVSTMKERYCAVLIDEFQDTDPVQYNIFNTFFGNGDHILFYIGDPKQSIYSFRNADIFAYLNAISQMKDEKYSMDVNYRSCSGLVRAVEAVFTKKGDRPFEIEGIDLPKVSAKKSEFNRLSLNGEPCSGIELRFMRSDSFKGYQLGGRSTFKNRKVKTEHAKERAVSDMVFTIIEMLKNNSEYLIEGKKVEASDIAVLVDTNNDADLVRRNLSAYGVPAVTSSNVSVYLSDEAGDVLVVAEAMNNPVPSRVKAALLSVFFRKDIGYISDLEHHASVMEGWVFFFSELQQIWADKGFLSAFNRFLNSNDVFETVALQKEGERSLTNIRHLMELIHRFEQEDLSSLQNTVDWLKEKINDAGQAEEEQLRLESDAQAVNIVTIHRSKGLDYPIVFCPAMWRKSEPSWNSYYLKYHDDKKERVLSFQKSDKDAKEQYRIENLSENLRLAYVAMTRAKYQCIIYWGNIYGLGSCALANLFHGVKGYSDFNKFTDDKMLLDLIDIETQSDGAVKVKEAINSPFYGLDLSVDNKEMVPARSFDKEIVSNWGITSFSALSSHAHGALEDSELFEEKERESQEKTDGADPSILDFPAGAAAGTALHAVFEEIDFKSDNNAKIISEVLEKYNLRFSQDDEDMTPWVEKCINEVLDSPVFDGKTLRDVKPDEILSEMEFFFEVDDFQTQEINELFKGKISVLQNTANGFIHGFIDLIFKLDGKYYIVDWKSNKLGDKKEDYTDKAVEDEMKKHNYIFQYMLYTCALDKYLSVNSDGYSFGKDFGGVSYVFLRGPTFYNDKPDEKMLKKFNEILRGKAR